ncbi:uncharacterized protein [Anabrus simplex]|uniref:uncharacterized protein n=1 Tax=Anabrus simplex TaxID=316456 RepID=UPI0034DD41AA
MSDSSTAAHSEILASQGPSKSADINTAAGALESAQNKIKRLEQELQIRTEERENFKNKLQAVEKELADLRNATEAQVAGVGDPEHAESIDKLREDNNSLRQALNKAAELIKDKTSLCVSQERQNIALTNQIGSLKEVIKITKDLLNIRNMEVHHLQCDVENMEAKIKMERDRQSTMISKMDEAVKLNAELKTEYVNQLKIFQDLKARYEERAQLLEKENKEKSDGENKEQKSSELKERKHANKLESAEHVHRERRRSLSRVDSAASDLDEFLDAHEEIVGN